VNSPHTTSAIIVNENESGLKEDILRKIREEFPRGEGWHHDLVDDNADAHLAAVFLGHSKTLLLRDGKIVRGTWQTIFFLELDGPRSRSVQFEVMGV
ncbi:MAG: secondary thiamine-phosphate synthase enzyme YjbQ, partial [Candidatus Bathyarchaeota archaeon]|nr:secondary thiamine-phosphate synthase enzyme YjbQ [Candidatus Bathyarchaeota archaeon]